MPLNIITELAEKDILVIKKEIKLHSMWIEKNNNPKKMNVHHFISEILTPESRFIDYRKKTKDHYLNNYTF